MRIVIFLLIFQALFADKLYVDFCTKDENVICLVYRGEIDKNLKPPKLIAKNGDIKFIKKKYFDWKYIDDYTVFLYRVEYQSFLDILPITLGKFTSKEKFYSFTNHKFETFEEKLFSYTTFRYAPESNFLEQFKRNILISLFLIFPLYFFIMLGYKVKKRNDFLKKLGVKEKLSSYEEVKNFYKFLITNSLKDEYEEFNKKIGKMYFNQKRIFQKTPIKEDFEEFLKIYLKLDKIDVHLKRVFFIYLFVAIILTIWIYL